MQIYIWHDFSIIRLVLLFDQHKHSFHRPDLNGHDECTVLNKISVLSTDTISIFTWRLKNFKIISITSFKNICQTQYPKPFEILYQNLGNWKPDMHLENTYPRLEMIIQSRQAVVISFSHLLMMKMVIIYCLVYFIKSNCLRSNIQCGFRKCSAIMCLSKKHFLQ